MCTSRDDFGVDEVAKAAYKVACRCGGEGCVLPPQPGEVVRYRVEDIVRAQADPKVAEVESND